MEKLFILILLLLQNGFSADWYTWRGPDGNGISGESDWEPRAIEKLWTVNVGQGYSSVSIKDGRVLTVGNIDNRDIIFCLDEKTGDEIWRYTYKCDNDNRYPGPRSMPVIHENKVYTISMDGQIFCLEFKSGKLIWKKNIFQDFGREIMKWGLASSPTFSGRLMLINAAKNGIAIDKDSGEKIWVGDAGTGGYSTPVIYQKNGIQYAAMMGNESIYCIEAETGKVIWSYPWLTKYGNNASDPVIIGDNVFISSGYGMGCLMLDISGDKPGVLWQNDHISSHFGSSIYLNGKIYGTNGRAGRSKGKDKGEFVCLDAKTGQKVWTQPIGFNSFIFSDNKFIILVENGDLIIADISNGKYKQLVQKNILNASANNPCWTAPVLSNGKIYCRNHEGDMVCLDVSK